MGFYNIKKLCNYIKLEVKPNIVLENKKAIIYTISKVYINTISKYLDILAYYNSKDKKRSINLLFIF